MKPAKALDAVLAGAAVLDPRRLGLCLRFNP